MTDREQATAARLLLRWAKVAGNFNDDCSFRQWVRDTAEVELLRIETRAFLEHAPTASAVFKALG